MHAALALLWSLNTQRFFKPLGTNIWCDRVMPAQLPEPDGIFVHRLGHEVSAVGTVSAVGAFLVVIGNPCLLS